MNLPFALLQQSPDSYKPNRRHVSQKKADKINLVNKVNKYVEKTQRRKAASLGHLEA